MWGNTREKDLVWRGALVWWASVEAEPVLAFFVSNIWFRLSRGGCSPLCWSFLSPVQVREGTFPIVNRFCAV